MRRMTALKEPLHPLFSLVIALFLSLSVLVLVPGQSVGSTTEELSKGNNRGEFFDLEFPEGGGRDPSVAIYLPNSGPVLTSSLMISTIPGKPGPETVFVDVGSDERAEWNFGGGEEGRFGLQDSFITGRKVIRDRLDGTGRIYSLYLPEEAYVHTARMKISSPPTPEVEGLVRTFRIDTTLIPVEAMDAGDIDDDGLVEFIYYDGQDGKIYAVDTADDNTTSRVAMAENMDGLTTLTFMKGPDAGRNGIVFSRTNSGQGSVEVLMGNDPSDMEWTTLSSGLPPNSSGYHYDTASKTLNILSGPSGRILRAVLDSSGDLNVEERLDSSIAGSAIAEADLDGDGDRDLVLFPGSGSSWNITYCESNMENGQEVLSLKDSMITYGSQGTPAVVDLDGDGRDEVYITIGPHKRIAVMFLDQFGSLSMNWIGLNNTDGRPRALPRSDYGNGTVYGGLEGLLYISTPDGLYHVLPCEDAGADHVWRKAASYSSVAILAKVRDGYGVATIGRDSYLYTGNARWSFGRDISIRSIDDEVQLDLDLGNRYRATADIEPFIVLEYERSKKTSASGNILLRYDLEVLGFDGFLSLSELEIDYDASIDASNSKEFRPAVQKVIDVSDIDDIPITVRSTSSGAVRIGPVEVTYDSPPWVLDTLPGTITVQEGAPGSSIFNIRDHIRDDNLLPQGLDVAVVPGPEIPPNMLFFDRNGNLVSQPFRFPDLNGEFLFAISISDLRNTVQTEPITLIVEPTQDPPVITGMVDEITMFEGEEFFLELAGENGFFSDPDGDPLDFDLRITNPQPATLRDTTELSLDQGVLRIFSPITGTGGSYRLEMLASDGSDEHDPVMGVLKVNLINIESTPNLGRNPGPVILMEDQDTPSRIPLAGWFMDPDTNLAEYTFNVFSPSPLLEASIRGTASEPYLNLHPRGDLFGEFTLMMEMTGVNTNLMDRLEVEVVPVNDAPEIHLDSKDLLENRGWLLNGNIRDPDSMNGIVEYRIGDGEWKRAWGFESWSLIIDFPQMPSGSAFIFIRAYDGEEYSPVTYVKLTTPEPPIPPPVTGDDDVGDDDDDDIIVPPDDDDGIDIVPHPSSDGDAPWLLFGGAAGIILAAMIFFGFTEVGVVIMFTVGSSIYSKLSKKDILNHEVRGLIRGYIIANPGDHYSSIKRNLDLNNGTLAYHLRVLEQSGFIKSMYDGIYKRYYPSNVNISKLKKNVSKQEEIFNIILENPGVTMEEIGRMIGVSRQVVNYHVKNLIRAGVVSYLRDRKSAKFYPQDNGGNMFEQT
ncbi:MAG: winged helix-turn-helix transcriptional regulator [Thermoplasmatota archaeon]